MPMIKATQIRHRRRIIAKRFAWIYLPVFFLAVMEVTARMSLEHQPEYLFWYARAEQLVRSKKIDYIFVGSSRVAAAIDTKSFERVLSSHLGQPVTALNMGMGYSTMAEHFLGLRNLWSAAPHHLQGTTIFISLETGLPYHDTWQTRWTHPDRPRLINSLLKFSDLIHLWQTSGLPFQEKLNLSQQYFRHKHFQKVSVALSNRESIRDQFLSNGTTVSIKLLKQTGLVSNKQRSHPPTPDLKPVGGIRNDVSGVKQARDLAIKLADLELQNQQPIRNWDRTILADLVHFVTKHGGQVVFFETPISSVQAHPMQTSLRQTDRKIFEEKAQAWCAIILKPRFVTHDSYLPDLWHLSSSLAPQFTDALAEVFIEHSNKTDSIPSTAGNPKQMKNCSDK
jgi:hypothetical protein